MVGIPRDYGFTAGFHLVEPNKPKTSIPLCCCASETIAGEPHPASDLALDTRFLCWVTLFHLGGKWAWECLGICVDAFLGAFTMASFFSHRTHRLCSQPDPQPQGHQDGTEEDSEMRSNFWSHIGLLVPTESWGRKWSFWFLSKMKTRQLSWDPQGTALSWKT